MCSIITWYTYLSISPDLSVGSGVIAEWWARASCFRIISLHTAPATQRWCIFQINAPQSLSTIARKGDYVTGWPRMIKRGPTWRREEWRWPLYVNARPHAIQRLCSLSACPLRLPLSMQDAFTRKKKKKYFGVSEEMRLAFSTRYVSHAWQE